MRSQIVLRVPATFATLRSEALPYRCPGAWAGIMKRQTAQNVHQVPTP